MTPPPPITTRSTIHICIFIHIILVVKNKTKEEAHQSRNKMAEQAPLSMFVEPAMDSKIEPKHCDNGMTESEVQVMVKSYLERVSQGIAILANRSIIDDKDASSSKNGEYYMDRMARSLLQACHPAIICLPVPDGCFQQAAQAEDTQDKKEEERLTGLVTRVDFLRSLLRSMAPIAFDVGARVCSIVLSSSGESVTAETAVSSFILFGTWIAIAPQLAPLVSDLFSCSTFGSPFDYVFASKTSHISDQDKDSMEVDDNTVTTTIPGTQSFCVAEAAHALCAFFAKREEYQIMNQWWNWVGLYTMARTFLPIDTSISINLTNKSEAMEVDDIDYEEDGGMGDKSDLEEKLGWKVRPFDVMRATAWHAARAACRVLTLRPAARKAYVQRLGLQQDMVPWVRHPWLILEQEERSQCRHLRGMTLLWETEKDEFELPTCEQIRLQVPVHPSLAHLGGGILLPRRSPFSRQKIQSNSSDGTSSSNLRSQQLILTPTTTRNLCLLGVALSTDPHPPPILICGPRGAGKSSLVRELAQCCNTLSSDPSNQEDLLELHVDEETDSKTLLGSYTTTDIPGEFTWRRGALTQAVREGKWVLLEDVDSCPIEIQAALIKLLEERILPLGIGKNEKCHPNFRLFGTCTTDLSHSSGSEDPRGKLKRAVAMAGVGGKKILHPSLWRKVHVDPLPYAELKQVARSRFASIPESISDAALTVFRSLDKSGRIESSLDGKSADGDKMSGSDHAMEEIKSSTHESSSSGPLQFVDQAIGRHASVRDFMKLVSRISSSIHFEPNVEFATESQRTLCLAETVDVFAMSCPTIEARREFVIRICAPVWNISPDLAWRYIEKRQPSIKINRTCIEVGRATIAAASLNDEDSIPDRSSQTFTETNHVLRLMESAGVCIAQNEAVLLVGETGVGKTTVIQRLAKLSGHELVVQNLSLQTDSTDLLGGFRPLDMRHIARRMYLQFVDIFVTWFSRSQNLDFLNYVAVAYEKGQWKRLSQCFRRAAQMGMNKMRESKAMKDRGVHNEDPLVQWKAFTAAAEHFERQRIAGNSGLAFAFTEGGLVEAIRTGKWVLLDEINLATSEIIQRLCGLLDDSHGSITLTERGDAKALTRHPDFRLFAAMNPATDAGKKDLPSSVRSRFTELYVDELVDPVELRLVAARYLSNAMVVSDTALEHSDIVMRCVNVYLQCRELSEQILVDGGGQRPRFTMRTLCRALSAARTLVTEQRFQTPRAILEGFELALEGPLSDSSRVTLKATLNKSLAKDVSKSDPDHPVRRPGGKNGKDQYVLIKPFWIKAGDLKCVDWAEASSESRCKFVVTPSASLNLRRLARAVASGPYPVLLEGPTSAGKTFLVEYLAARCGHKCIRINNHEHTDVQEYTGCYAADSNGALSFRDGILVQALKQGHWVILDELNLAPSEVLEALNRLLDDNRELYLAETNETLRPHESFRIFATQNPCGAYGGRKALSRAFRNRFVEIHMGDIPSEEMTTILKLRCGCPPSHAKMLVKVMTSLRQRRNKRGIFLGKDGLITPRDLLRWAERHISSTHDLAMEGFMLLAERLRENDEKDVVKEVIEEHFKISLNCDSIYYGKNTIARRELLQLTNMSESMEGATGLNTQAIAPTKCFLRLLTLVQRCIKQKEPVLLVGDTGCGKTTCVQLLAYMMRQKLLVVNCHATTETSDLLGSLRPLRGRERLLNEIMEKAKFLVEKWPGQVMFTEKDDLAPFLRCTNRIFTVDDKSLDTMELEKANSCDQKSCEHCSGAVVFPKDAVKKVISFVRGLWSSRLKAPATGPNDIKNKRRKLETGLSLNLNGEPKSTESTVYQTCKPIVEEIEALSRRYFSLFEWVDGPLVRAMREGHFMLLDEMSLADDAVLERLNSVLEPSRTLVLAEKGGEHASDSDSSVVRAETDFRIFATMNPGGDFGKRELSPALRSRFTEIWVPSVTSRDDINIVLERAFASALQDLPGDHTLSASANVIREKMTDYVEWFNDSICGDPGLSFRDLELSLRDVLAWARFIIDVSIQDTNLPIWLTYSHGASLIHLDGLGLGTGASLDSAEHVRKLAKSFLRNQIPESKSNERMMDSFENEREFIDESVIIGKGKFGIYPFQIRTGSVLIPQDIRFNLTAPTTALNLRRVLRAMQLSRPVLLEGSPGVGKTSLISALAKASGHHLTRINLSEQTDISDLMGSDLPIPDSEPTTDSSSGSMFKWCDGVLLKAIKRGDWVLLDELNLASQTVLEGLNSCLDHRSSVYIPELGQTFDCPSTFRVFAAQNPLAQGGGRKGLPKSFLNRFTKVYVEALTANDLRSIVKTRFPTIPESIAHDMVTFNSAVNDDVVVARKYGESGTPWEFNLRDIFRWCELLEATGQASDVHVVTELADVIYLQRFRCMRDREHLSFRFHQVFGVELKSTNYPVFNITDKAVLVGKASLERHADSQKPSHFVEGREPKIIRSLFHPMEAVARCVEMNWPVLLVGPSATGKSTILKTLCEACNLQLEEAAMTPSSDVNELIGCFEQIDSIESSKRLINLMELLHRVCCEHMSSKYHLHRLCNLHYLLRDELGKQGDEEVFATFLMQSPDLSKVADEFVRLCETQADENVVLKEKYFEYISEARDYVSIIISHQRGESKSVSASHFRWVDGLLVKAMERGNWLHLENVNLCPSAVLDRLNPLLENEGELVLAECGIEDDTGGNEVGPRVVKPHPNFRIFLSMDPSSAGEVSRPMRNRCVEISLLPGDTSVDEDSLQETSVASQIPNSMTSIDAIESMWNTGVRSSQLANLMFKLHGIEVSQMSREESSSPRLLKNWSEICAGLLRRGWKGTLSISMGMEISYQMHEDIVRNGLAIDLMTELSDQDIHTPMIYDVALRDDWSANPVTSRINSDSRLIRLFNSCDSQDLCSFIDSIQLHSQSSTYANISLGTTHDVDSIVDMRKHLLALFILKISSDEQHARASFMHGFCSNISNQLEILESCFMRAKSIMKNREGDLGSELHFPVFNEQPHTSQANGNWEFLLVSCSSRLAHILDEAITYQKLDQFDLQSSWTGQMSAIEVSFCLNEGKIDSSFITCPVTPILFPFFQALDDLIGCWEEWVLSKEQSISRDDILALKALFVNRDRCWVCLKESVFSFSDTSSFLGFDEPAFLVQWTWLKKTLAVFFDQCALCVLSQETMKRDTASSRKEYLDLCILKIDDSLYEGSGSLRMSDKIWKRAGHPLVPAYAKAWVPMNELRACSKSLTLVSEEVGGVAGITSGSVESISFDSLLRENHPALYISSEFKADLLKTLCMIQWATTDEMNGMTRDEVTSFDVSKAAASLVKKIEKQKDEFCGRIISATVDMKVKTVENQLDTDEIRQLNEYNDESTSSSSTDIAQELLNRFGDIQLARFSEIWCVREEGDIIAEIAEICVVSEKIENSVSRIRLIIDRITRFVDVALAQTNISVAELRPYQTLVWACESQILSADSLHHLIQCIFPLIMCSFSEHLWCNTFNDLSSIDDVLQSPDNVWATELEVGRHRSLPSEDTELSFLGFNAGPPRLKQPVRSTAVFRLLGCLRRSAVGKVGSIPHVSLENYDVRLRQSRNVVEHLATLRSDNKEHADIFVVRHELINILQAVEEHFEDRAVSRFVALLRTNQVFSSDTKVDLIQACSHDALKKHMQKTFVPLLSALNQAFSTCSGEDMALAWIYVGLFRLHLLVPSSPLDPAKKPLAKVKQHDKYMFGITNALSAVRVDSGFSTGNFSPNTFHTQLLCTEAQRTAGKRSRQVKKCVERSEDAAPFLELFRETVQFTKTVASVESVNELVTFLQFETRKEKGQSSDLYNRELNWQSSASAFCMRLRASYACYEDVVIPLINAIRNLQRGLRDLAHLKVGEPSASEERMLRIQRSLLSFPQNDILTNSGTIEAVLASAIQKDEDMGKQSLSEKEDMSYVLPLLLSFLSRTELQVSVFSQCMEHDTLARCERILLSIVKSWYKHDQDSPIDAPDGRPENGNQHGVEAEEEILERSYRDQFPNHAKEFQQILETVELSEIYDDHELVENELIHPVSGLNVTTEDITLLVLLHRRIFSKNVEKVDDGRRIFSFRLAYDAASYLDPITQWIKRPELETQYVGAHTMALALSTTSIGIGPSNHHLLYDRFKGEKSLGIDFHKDPNPKEASKASMLMGRLLIRVTQLLKAFPGHAVLLAISQVANRVKQFDLNEVSVGKVLTGLEVILRKAQEWEQHASKHVKLGMPLKEISRLVTQWRKLELDDWSTLLDRREHKKVVESRKHWMRLYTLLHEEKTDHNISDRKQHFKLNRNTNITSACPRWVWKFLHKEMNTETQARPLSDVDEDMLRDLATALDTFLLTAVLGDFVERLLLVESFANQLWKECLSLHSEYNYRVAQARILESLWIHYNQYTSIIVATKKRLREPIEKRLKDEVKLAKWDEQSYYALSESSEKNHQKLMKLLREYDEVLGMRVDQILEQNTLAGIRLSSIGGTDADHQPVTTVPQNALIFPHISTGDESGSNMRGKWKTPPLAFISTNWNWTRFDDVESQFTDKYVMRMKLYQQKMVLLLEKDKTVRSLSQLGSEEAETLCSCVFERIDILRGAKVTKPMKQRALTDLFKTLKRHKFSSLRSSVPPELREMRYILQLPSILPNDCNILSGQAGKTLESAESYFHRSNVELSALRSEIALLGSKYMSQREMGLMMAFGEHGFLMLCQQRSMLSSVINCIQDMDRDLVVFSSIQGELRAGQVSILANIRNFDRSFLATIESISQLQLVMKTSIPLIEARTKREVIRDAIEIAENALTHLNAMYCPNGSPSLISEGKMKEYENIGLSLERVRGEIDRCGRACQESCCLPGEIFDSCLHQLDVAHSAAINISTVVGPTQDQSTTAATFSTISSLVQDTLISVQGLCKRSIENTSLLESGGDALDEENHDTLIWDDHLFACKELLSVRSRKLQIGLRLLTEQLPILHSSSTVSISDRNLCSGCCRDLSLLVAEVVEATTWRLDDFISFFRNAAKLNYVLLRVFRVLVAKGFCADDTSEDDGEGGGDMSGMNFEDDVEGTGMGEGAGNNDVTDQLESEEQLLGTKGEDEKKEESKQQDEQLNEEEAEQGMEMEADFEGDMFDMDENKKDKDENESGNDSEEELDREMGDGDDPNEEVVDEKMWDEDEDEDQEKNGEEKFEKDSKMDGEKLDDEMRTKDENEGNKNDQNEPNDEEKHSAAEEKHDESEANDEKGPEDSNDKVNDDFEDNYEDKQGVDVRDDRMENESEDDEDGAEGMNLENDMELDANDEDGDEMNVEDDNDDAEEDQEETQEVDHVEPQGEEENEEENMETSEQLDTIGQAGGETDTQENKEGEDDNDDDDKEETEEQIDLEPKPQQEIESDAHGVAAQNGADKVKSEEMDEQSENNDEGEGDDDIGDGADPEVGEAEESGNMGDQGKGEGQSNDTDDSGEAGMPNASDIPNPFREPGSAERYWHKKLNMVEGSPDEEDKSTANENTKEEEEKDNMDASGAFEFTDKNQDSSTQVLGESLEEDKSKLDDGKEEKINETVDKEEETKENNSVKKEENSSKRKKDSGSRSKRTDQEDVKAQNEDNESDAEEVMDEDINEDDGSASESEEENEEDPQAERNKIVTDLAQLQVREDENAGVKQVSYGDMVESEHVVGADSADMVSARLRWATIQNETNNLSRRLCEKLRLVMEPLVATKMRGDYRTGKRINMKRIIGYIASGYRRDKIWLRRTKPAKRNYRVLLAVDNSESMQKSGAGDMALSALATLANAMSQLEIGQLGIASFGDEMNLIHPFHETFSSESGTKLVNNFQFTEKRTRTALCVESAIAALEANGDGSSNVQLVFLISDGRIERDSRVQLRRLVREMSERNILLVMIIVEGESSPGKKKKDSIINMKEVNFENGKPKVTSFIDDYPFPYYMVLDDIVSLPEVLGDALRQWFEMLAQINSQATSR